MKKYNTFFKTVKGYWVYKNPDSSEIKEILENGYEFGPKAVRIGFTKNGDLYAWHYSILHDEIENYIGEELNVRAVVDLIPITFRMSAEAAGMSPEEVDSKYVLIRLKKAFPNANKQITKFMDELKAITENVVVSKIIDSILI